MQNSSDPTTDPTRVLVEQLAAEACMDVFAAHNVTLRRVSAAEPLQQGDTMTSVIGFSGPGIWGMCLLTSDRSPLSASNPAGGSARDWLAELVNQLAGRLKRKLIEQGATVYITTPIVLRAARIEPLPSTLAKPLAFAGADGQVELWVEVETAPDFRLAPDSAEPTIEEGDTILF